MAQPLLADVQYNDLQGTVAIDGHDGPPLQEIGQLVPLPPGFRPFAFELFRLYPLENGNLPLRVLATQTDEVGQSVEQLIDYEQRHGSLPVYSFDTEIAPASFRSIFKRFQLVATSRHWLGLKVETRSLHP